MTPLDGLVTNVGTTLFGIEFVPNITAASGTFAPCERRLMLPVPRGTSNWTVLPITLVPNVCAGNVGGRTGAACAGSQAVVGPRVLIAAPSTTDGMPPGLRAGDAL